MHFMQKQKYTEMYQYFPRLFCQKSGADQTTVCGKTLFSTCNFFRKTDETVGRKSATSEKGMEDLGRRPFSSGDADWGAAG